MGYNRAWLSSVFADAARWELRQFKHVEQWRKELFGSGGHSSKPILMYALPADIGPTIRADLESASLQGFGISGLQFRSLGEGLAAVPVDAKQPADYRLIEIREASKRVVHNSRTGRFQYIAEIHEWQYVPSDEVYVDMPHEPRLLEKLVFETIAGKERRIAQSLQAPAVGSPMALGGAGGISLAGLFGQSTFAKELLDTLELVLPPEYRSTLPPESWMNGTMVDHGDGIKIRVAHRPMRERHVFKGLVAQGLEPVSLAMKRRREFAGELSIVGMISPPEGKRWEVYPGLLRSWTRQEVTLADVDELMEADVDIRDFRKLIDEDLMYEMVALRRINPGLGTISPHDLAVHRKDVIQSAETLLLDQVNPTEASEFLARTALPDIVDNVEKLALNRARADHRAAASLDDLAFARNLTNDNLYAFVTNPSVRVVRQRSVSSKASERTRLIEAAMAGQGWMRPPDAWKRLEITTEFTSLADLIGALESLRKYNLVISDGKGNYMWVGRV